MKNHSQNLCPAIIVIAKVPQAGCVKTRLQPFLSGEQVASLAICFLRDTIATCRAVTSNVIVAFAPAEERETLESILPNEDLLFVEQSGADLGERIEFAIKNAESRNFKPIITIGADSPTLAPEFIKTAIESFSSNETDVVLGATRDGGFYLIGLREIQKGLFENITWSSPEVFEQMTGNIERLGMRLAKIENWYDVDTPDDLVFLRNEMLADEKTRNSAPQTFRWLASNAELLAFD